MKKKSVLLLYFLFLFWSCTKNNSDKNSVKVSDSIPIYLSLLKEEGLNSAKKLQYNSRVFKIIVTQKNSFSTRENLYEVANNFKKENENIQFRNVSHRLLENSLEVKDTINLTRAYKNLGTFHLDNNNLDSSFYYYLKAEKFATYAKDSLSLGEIYLDKAFVQLYLSDFYGSEISASKALGFLKKSQNKFKIYDAYNLIGINSNQIKNYENALAYHYKALNYFKTNNLNDKYHLDASSLNNIGFVYQNMNKNKEAVANFNVALKTKLLYQDNPDLYAMLLDNLGYSKFKLQDFSQLPDLFYQSLKIRDSLKTNSSGIVLTKIRLSEFFSFNKDTIKAQFYAKEALEESKASKVSSDILTSLKQLSNVDHKKASQYSKEYIRISDSVQQEDRIAKDKFARIAYETDEIIVEKGQLEEKNRTLLYIFIGTFAVGLLLFVIRAQRSKNRELLLKQQQQKVNEEIYNLMISQQATIEENRVKEKKRIAQELHDGVLGRMFGTRLNLDSLNRFSDDESVATRLNYLNELKSIEQDIREISHDLNREKIELVNNFVAIVHNLLEEQKNSFEPEVTFSFDKSIQWELLDNTTKINLYRILQESLQNSNKYAKAKNINVEFVKDIDNIKLKIVDDGIGFDTIGRKKGIGLQNMLSRANECEGTLDVISSKGSGTTITITIPMNKNKVTV